MILMIYWISLYHELHKSPYIGNREWMTHHLERKKGRGHVWHYTLLMSSPLELRLLCRYWQVMTTVNRHMQTSPTEQMSTTHRYTSVRQGVHTPAGHNLTHYYEPPPPRTSIHKCHAPHMNTSRTFAAFLQGFALITLHLPPPPPRQSRNL